MYDYILKFYLIYIIILSIILYTIFLLILTSNEFETAETIYETWLLYLFVILGCSYLLYTNYLYFGEFTLINLGVVIQYTKYEIIFQFSIVILFILLSLGYTFFNV